jgi:hypothetical protein
LRIEVAPEDVDVNVHPAKLEGALPRSHRGRAGSGRVCPSIAGGTGGGGAGRRLARTSDIAWGQGRRTGTQLLELDQLFSEPSPASGTLEQESRPALSPHCFRSSIPTSCTRAPMGSSSLTSTRPMSGFCMRRSWLS